jgi:protein-disulfide isomerase
VRAKRRDLLIIGATVGVIYGLRALPWDRYFGRGPTYSAIAGLAPFRTLKTSGQVSGASAALVGLDALDGNDPTRLARVNAVKTDICGALFGKNLSAGVVPIAYFSEFRCPNCRALEGDLDEILAEESDTVQLVQHELPIFGPASKLAARASVAAARQGLQQPLRQRFMRTSLVADQRSVLAVAASIGLDSARLARDMNSAEVQAELDRTRALADVFGFSGTPGLVIGRTVVEGAVPGSLLRRIIAHELSLPPLAC